MKAFKVIRPFDIAAAEKAAAKETKRKKQSKKLDDYLTRDVKKNLAAAGMWSFPYPDPKKYFRAGQKFTTADSKVGDDEVVYQRSFDSSKGVKDKYTVRVRRDGSMSCNCMGWSVKKSAHRSCPHCTDLANDLAIHMRIQ